MPTPILYLSALGGLGGGESILLTHLPRLERAAFEPRVICGTPGAFAEELRAQNIPVEVIPFKLPYFRAGWLPTMTFSFVPRLARYVREHGIRLIHCNDPESAYYAAPFARVLNIPVVWTCHGWWTIERGWKARFHEILTTQIIVPTHLLKRTLSDIHPRLRDKATVVSFGVDTSKFSPGVRDAALDAELGLAPDHLRVTLLARFQPVKGHEYLLRAAPRILDAFPNTQFLLVGDNVFDTREGAAYKREILGMINADERLKASVLFAGYRRDVPRLLRATDVSVCPSLFESYGVALLEAMACAVPVVSTNVGGPSETIVEGETGWLIPPRDPEALAARVCELLGNPDLRRRMGENGRRRVETRYNLSNTVAQLERVYKELLGNPHPNPSPPGRGAS